MENPLYKMMINNIAIYLQSTPPGQESEIKYTDFAKVLSIATCKPVEKIVLDIMNSKVNL